MSQLATPRPVSPPYSQHSPLVHHLGPQGGTVPQQQAQSHTGAGRPAKRAAGSDCNDNVTGVDSSGAYSHPAKKGRKGELPDGALKSVDGGSSCRTTPLTPLSSKSGGSQDGTASPNGTSPSLYGTSTAFRAPAVMSGMMMTGSGSVSNDPSAYSAVHQTAPSAYYQQPYYHHLYANPHQGYYHQTHQGWTTDFGLHHASSVPSLAPGASYQHSFPLTPDGSCTNSAGDTSSSVSTLYGAPGLQSGKVKDPLSDEHHQTDAYPPMEHSANGLTHSLGPSSDLSAGVGVATSRESMLDYPYKSGDCADSQAPSYYTK